MVSRVVQIALVAVTTVMLILTLVFNYLSTSDLGYQAGLFAYNSSIPWTERGNLTASSLTPPGWAFSIWAVIYLYQGAMLAYCWSLLFRRSSHGEPLCCVPGLLPVGFLVAHCISSVFNIAWVFLADRVPMSKPLLTPQTLVLFFLAISIWICLAFSLQQLQANGQELQSEGLGKEYWLVIGLIQNSCGLYVGWTSIASFLNLDVAIVNLAGYPAENSSLLCLCQVCLLLGMYIVADFSFLDRYMRFVIAPYVTLLWALVTSVAGNYRAGSARSDVSVQLMAVLAVALVAKVIVAIIRQKRSPQPWSVKGSRSQVSDSSIKLG
ncbi:hypothetical protein BOX15_Mlig022351g1 [Macrostomum lignano]|uniref:Uncharacterized protein n=1 Tax=Macrostomum lignano TaxID=282301 RepID=A0A267H6F3_9PLAT|nr:hypothetical protein BOX15_Mlig022351g3 [Macrostomum lignano]PAA93132.1 hypothetical protein BOX15_Mlig022351g1 [Macrostomum lignano]